MATPIEITKNHVIGISIGTFLSLFAGMWFTVGEVQGYITQITMNTQAIQGVVLSLELSRVDRQIEGFKKERRELKRQLRDDPGNGLLIDQIMELDDSIEDTQIIRECVVDPTKEVCK
jgi:hypothetical protein